MSFCLWNADGSMSCVEKYENPTPVFTYSLAITVQNSSQTRILAQYSYPFIENTKNPILNMRPDLFQQNFTTVTLTIEDTTLYTNQPPLNLYVYYSDNSQPILVNFKGNAAQKKVVVVPDIPFNNITIAFVRN